MGKKTNKTAYIPLNVSAGMKKWILEQAKDRDVSRGKVIRDAVQEKIDREAEDLAAIENSGFA